nr:MAG TPA: hypothetical protein [Bacteriophage sp.]
MSLSVIDERTTFRCYFVETIKRLRSFLCVLKEESIVDKIS